MYSDGKHGTLNIFCTTALKGTACDDASLVAPCISSDTLRAGRKLVGLHDIRGRARISARLTRDAAAAAGCATPALRLLRHCVHGMPNEEKTLSTSSTSCLFFVAGLRHRKVSRAPAEHVHVRPRAHVHSLSVLARASGSMYDVGPNMSAPGLAATRSQL